MSVLFMLCGYVKKETNEWWLSILNGVNTHKMEKKFERHLVVGRLSEKNKKIVVDLTKSLMRLKHISVILKNERKDNLTNKKPEYNARERFKKSTRAKKLEMQHMIMMIEHHMTFWLCF